MTAASSSVAIRARIAGKKYERHSILGICLFVCLFVAKEIIITFGNGKSDRGLFFFSEPTKQSV